MSQSLASLPPAIFPDSVLVPRAQQPAEQLFDELFFEPGSGRLVLRRPGETAPDAVPATQMARTGFFADGDGGTRAVLQRLEHIADDDDGDDLMFDPATGRLTVRPRGEAAPGPDAVSAVQMARTGFFGVRRRP